MHVGRETTLGKCSGPVLALIMLKSNLPLAYGAAIQGETFKAKGNETCLCTYPCISAWLPMIDVQLEIRSSSLSPSGYYGTSAEFGVGRLAGRL